MSVEAAALKEKVEGLALSDNDTPEPNGVAPEVSAEKKKKKKKKNQKKKKKQTEPPTVGLSKLFPSGNYPEGELQDYNDSLVRKSSAEKRELEQEPTRQQKYNDLRRAAEVHRQVRHYAQRTIKPGMSMIEIADLIEDGVEKLSEGENWKAAGQGFPTGLSLNEVAAHYTPNKGDKTILSEKDVMKVDFGAHVNGNIIDSAFTMTFDPKYDRLLEAVREATNTGIKEAGIDVRLGDIGAAIQEVMESYEVELDGKVYPVKCIENLNGHNIQPYRIHGGKSVPIVKSADQTKMEEDEVYAIETFASTGRGYVLEEGECSHYALNAGASNTQLHLQSAKNLKKAIQNTFGTLPFCRRYLDKIGQEKYLLGLNNLVKTGVVQDYPPLVDSPGAYTAQFEHTLVLRPTVKEVLSRGDDY